MQLPLLKTKNKITIIVRYMEKIGTFHSFRFGNCGRFEFKSTLY